MCGIFGTFKNENTINFTEDFKDIGTKSESRGKEASGYLYDSRNAIEIYKSPKKFSDKINLKHLNKLIKQEAHSNFLIGHTRLKTEGDESNPINNQPCELNEYILVHNGIITNHNEIKERSNSSHLELDSYAILNILQSDNKKINFVDNFIQSLNELKGEITICLFSKKENSFILYTNTGSIYLLVSKRNEIKYFASERWILEEYVNSDYSIVQLKAFNGLSVNQNGKISREFKAIPDGKENTYIDLDEIKLKFYKKKIEIPLIKRCQKCILPETVPFINFNKEGVCNYCLNHQLIPKKDINEFIKNINKEKNIILGFSGGRDSSYGLDFTKKIYNGNLICVSYDWGMITELARRNQARVSGKLGVEHVWASADIQKKRSNIKKNLHAWLEKPDLGMIPILMSGDKVWQGVLHGFAEKNKSNIILQFQSPYEVTQFKYGFANVKPIFSISDDKYLNTGLYLKVKLFIYYVVGILKNYRYWNSSLLDSLIGYISFSFRKTKLVYPFEFIDFDEDTIDKTLSKEFQWEFDEHNPSSWRIGDGTAPFYNFVYWKYCGFTENDFFRSNQIRDGKLNRNNALMKTLHENQIKEKRIKEYLNYIDADYEVVMDKLNRDIERNSKVKDWVIDTFDSFNKKNLI